MANFWKNFGKSIRYHADRWSWLNEKKKHREEIHSSYNKMARILTSSSHRQTKEKTPPIPHEYLLKEFKTALQNPDLQLVFNRFSSLMSYEAQQKQLAVNHDEITIKTFNSVCKHLPPNDIEAMASLVSQSPIMNFLVSEQYALNERNYRVSEGMRALAKNAPHDKKIEIYNTLEQTGFLENAFRNMGSGDSVSNFVNDIFKETSTELALHQLSNSQAWRALEKTQNLTESMFVTNNGKLTEALNYN